MPAGSEEVSGLYAERFEASRRFVAETASFIFDLTDADKTVTVTAAGATTATVPPAADVAFALGTELEIVQLGAGACTMTAGSGVTFVGTGVATNATTAPLRSATKVGTNTWYVR